jgi:hypothetical protein
MTDARESRPSDLAASATRRQLVVGACASAATLSFASALGLPFGVSPAFAFAPPAGGGLDAFVALSLKLTGRTNLSPELSKRIYDALAQSDSAFAQHVAALNAWLKAHGGVPSDTVTAALQAQDPGLAKVVGAVMRAWYFGLVGDMPTVKVVAYETALMFDPVKDVLTIPSYCRDAPFYWTHKPAGG